MDHEVSLHGHLGVAVLNLLRDPVLEILTDDSGNYIYKPLLGYMLDIFWIWKISVHLVEPARPVEYLLDAQVLVLGHVERLDLVVGHVSLLSGDDVLQEVDGDIF